MVPVSINLFTKTFHAYHQVVHEIDHMSDLHLDSSFCKQSMDIDNYFKIKKWHVISVTWSNRKNLSNRWSNGKKLITFHTGYIKGSDHCIIGDLGIMRGNTYLTGCIGELLVSIGV